MVKNPLRYWFWRIYTAAVWAAFAVTVSLFLCTLDLTYLRCMLLLMPFYIVAVFAWCNMMVFPFHYSVAGKYKRAPLPQDEPLYAVTDIWSYAGRSNLWIVTWLLYRQGIGVKMVSGRAFIRLEQIDTIDLERGPAVGFVPTAMSTILHHCPEMREPIYVSRRTAQIMSRYYPAKTLVEGRAPELR